MPVIPELRPDEAAKLLHEHPAAVLLDVRSTMEYQYVGHPLGALHIPWSEPPDWRVDTQFVNKVRQQLETQPCPVPVEQAVILTLCRSGARSRAAATVLAEQGFTHVYNIAEGFEGDRDANNHRSSINGWRFRGLPWEQG
jgi:rhodanese-related sulfurtransferase